MLPASSLVYYKAASTITVMTDDCATAKRSRLSTASNKEARVRPCRCVPLPLRCPGGGEGHEQPAVVDCESQAMPWVHGKSDFQRGTGAQYLPWYNS